MIVCIDAWIRSKLNVQTEDCARYSTWINREFSQVGQQLRYWNVAVGPRYQHLKLSGVKHSQPLKIYQIR